MGKGLLRPHPLVSGLVHHKRSQGGGSDIALSSVGLDIDVRLLAKWWWQEQRKAGQQLAAATAVLSTLAIGAVCSQWRRAKLWQWWQTRLWESGRDDEQLNERDVEHRPKVCGTEGGSGCSKYTAFSIRITADEHFQPSWYSIAGRSRSTTCRTTGCNAVQLGRSVYGCGPSWFAA